MAEKEVPQDFAATLARLEGLVTRLEAGDMSLEASLGAFEEGVSLAREAQQRLDSAELRLQALVEGEKILCAISVSVLNKPLSAL